MKNKKIILFLTCFFLFSFEFKQNINTDQNNKLNLEISKKGIILKEISINTSKLDFEKMIEKIFKKSKIKKIESNLYSNESDYKYSHDEIYNECNLLHESIYIDKVIEIDFVNKKNILLILSRPEKDIEKHTSGRNCGTFIALFDLSGNIESDVLELSSTKEQIGIFTGKEELFILSISDVTYNGWQTFTINLYGIEKHDTKYNFIDKWLKNDSLLDLDKNAISLINNKIKIKEKILKRNPDFVIPEVTGYKFSYYLIWDSINCEFVKEHKK